MRKLKYEEACAPFRPTPEAADDNLAMRQNPQDGRVWSASALAKLLEMKLEPALFEFKKAVSFMPKHMGTWHGMGWCNLMRMDLPVARQNVDAALALDRNFGETYGGLAVVLALESTREEAKGNIERALRLDPAARSACYAEAVLKGEAIDQAALRRLA